MDWEMIFSFVTVAAAVGGIYLTWKQKIPPINKYFSINV